MFREFRPTRRLETRRIGVFLQPCLHESMLSPLAGRLRDAEITEPLSGSSPSAATPSRPTIHHLAASPCLPFTSRPAAQLGLAPLMIARHDT